MIQKAKAIAFLELHVKGSPVELFNIWDAGSAKTVAKSGAAAIATGSWSVAAAQGYSDAEALPLDAALANARAIVEAVDLPVTIDFEGAYAVEPEAVGRNVAALIGTGAIGCNFEDQVIGGAGLHDINLHSDRIRAAVAAADAADVRFVLNARTDVFLKADAADHAGLLDAALERAAAYKAAGARSFFAPGLVDIDLIRSLAAGVELPLNIMWRPDAPERTALAGAGVARISHGPFPYRRAMEWLSGAAPYTTG